MPFLKLFRLVESVSVKTITLDSIFLVLYSPCFRIFRLKFPKCGFFYAGLYCGKIVVNFVRLVDVRVISGVCCCTEKLIRCRHA